jgi:hypothetical protein
MSKRSEQCCEDRISQLPDDVLVNILSRLMLKEAGQSSIMSSRWKTLWTFKTGILDFADPIALSEVKRCNAFLPILPFLKVLHHMTNQFNETVNQLQNLKNNYAKMVNQVVKSHQGANIDGFKVCFELDNAYKSDFDSWIEFAIRKKSQILEVDLKQEFKRDRNLYYFPKEIFLSFKSNIKILRSLRLCWVEVSGPDDLHDILTNCTSLEALSILGSNSMRVAEFCGPLKLKFIEIRDCRNLQAVQVSAGNLESLVCYGGKDINFDIHHAPKLKTVHLGGEYTCQDPFPFISGLSPVARQIETLVLDFTAVIFVNWKSPGCRLPQLKNLRCLELKVTTNDHTRLIYSMSLFKECPMLDRLKVEFDWQVQRNVMVNIERKMEKIELEEKLNWLKVMEFKWFGGRPADVELVMSLLDNAPNVETLIFDPNILVTPRNPFAATFDTDEDMNAARDSARHLANNHSPQAHFILL